MSCSTDRNETASGFRQVLLLRASLNPPRAPTNAFLPFSLCIQHDLHFSELLTHRPRMSSETGWERPAAEKSLLLAIGKGTRVGMCEKEIQQTLNRELEPGSSRWAHFTVCICCRPVYHSVWCSYPTQVADPF